MQQTKLTRAEQARVNGAKSTGPSSKQGLERCRLASVKHGGYVAAVSVIPGEDQRQYEGMWLSLVDQYQPRNLAETTVLASLLDAIWRHRRLTRAANHETIRKMDAITNDSSIEHESIHDVHLRAETDAETVTRLEARARHHMREIAALQRILESMQKRSVSNEASQMSNEIMDLVGADIEIAIAEQAAEQPEQAAAEPKQPPTPGKRPPNVENLPRKARKRLRQC